MAGPYQWDTSTPPGGESRRLGDNQIRAMKLALDTAFKDGPMSNWPTDAHCTPGWPRVFRYDTLAALQANAVAAPYNRLGVVTADPDPNLTGMYLEKSTGWTLIQG